MTAAPSSGVRDRVTVVVWGTPSPQGSKTAYRRGDRVVLAEGRRGPARARHREWRSAVAAACRVELDRRGGRVFGDDARGGAPVMAVIDIAVPKPRSRPKYLRWAPFKPDIDKLARAVLDGVSVDSGLLADDSRVVALVASKRYAVDGQAPGAVITLVALEHGDGVRVAHDAATDGIVFAPVKQATAVAQGGA